MKEEQIRNVAKVFEAFAIAIANRENIKIEYLNDEGVIENLTIEISRVVPLFALDIYAFVKITESGAPVFNQNITDIQSVTTFRTTELTFSETESEEESEEEKDYSF